MRRLLVAAAVLVAVLAPAAPAWAHAQLVAAEPARDAVLTGSPEAVTLKFNERLRPDFTTIVLSDAARQRVPTSAVQVRDAAGTLTLTGPLTEGRYTVAYRVVSVDGHTVQGSYPFTVGAATQPAGAATQPVAAAGPAGGGGIPAPLLAGLAGGGVLVAGAAGRLLTTTRRRRAVGSR